MLSLKKKKMPGNVSNHDAQFRITSISKQGLGSRLWPTRDSRNTVMYSYETSHFVPPPAPAKESECFAGGLWGPHVCRACLELRNQSVRSPSFPLLDLPQLHLFRKESGTPQAHFAETLRHPSVNQRPPASCRAPHAEPAPVARRTWRREARAHAVTSPHLAPAAGAGVARGGPRGRGRKKSQTILARFRPSRVPTLGAPASA